jgi:hypothetical protein
MVSYDHNPQVKLTVTTSGTAYEIDGLESGKIIRNENGFDIADFIVQDAIGVDASRYYPSKIAGGSLVKCEMKDASESSWTTVFSGIIRFVYVRMSDQGWSLELKCDGAGYGFVETVCREEYGTESRNPSLDTIKAILTNGTKGVIPKFVNGILGSGSSGYSYNYDNVDDIAGSMLYVYFPFKPCDKTVGDLCDLVQAIKGVNPGPHWIVDTDSKFRLKTIGVDQTGWTGYYGGNQAAATLEQGIDLASYSFEDLASEANYVLYYGVLRKPAFDYLTEGHANLWHDPGDYINITDESTIVKVGTYSLKVSTTQTRDTYYPNGGAAGWDFTKIGSKKNPPTFNFWARIEDVPTLSVQMGLYTDGSNYFKKTIFNSSSAADTWYWHSLRIGDDYGYVDWDHYGSPSWSNINFIDIWHVEGACVTYWDDMHFEGLICRAAKNSTKITSDKLKTKIIIDNVGKDDSMTLGDDTGTMARLVYSELLRCQTTPLVGEIRVPCLKTLLPGQLLHIHAKRSQVASGTFNVDKDMRATRHEIDFDKVNGFQSRIGVTSDVTNSYPRMAWTDMNKIYAATRPEFQDRQATTIKTGILDLDVPILEKDYAS